jgi:hypothetical protein
VAVKLVIAAITGGAFGVVHQAGVLVIAITVVVLPALVEDDDGGL